MKKNHIKSLSRVLTVVLMFPILSFSRSEDCSAATYWNGERCIKIPSGMQKSFLSNTDSLSCLNEYVWVDSKKKCIALPANAELYEENGKPTFMCIDGYFKDGLSCVKIPEHGFIGISEKLQCDVGYLIKQKLCVPDQDRFVFGFVIGGVRNLFGCEESESTAYYHKTGETEYALSSERYNVKQTPLTVVKYSVSCLADSGWATNTIETIEACYKNDTLLSLNVVAPSEHKEFVKKKLNKRYKKISEKKSKSFDGSASIFTEYRGTKYVDVSVGEDWARYWIWYQYRPIDNMLMQEADSLYLKGY